MAVDIFLLDDDPTQGATRKAILDRAGYHTAIVSTGHEALKFLASSEGHSVRLVLTDHSMPGMSGSEFVRTLRANGFDFPVLVLSGYPDVEEDYRTLNVTVRTKPFPSEQLISLVRYLVDSSNLRSA